jgi:hypothetical protein
MPNQNNETNQKPSYTRSAFYFDRSCPIDDPKNGSFGCVEGFVKRIRSREVELRGEKRKVATMQISAILRDSYAKDISETLLNDTHSVTFNVSYWGYDADNLLKYPLDVNQKALCLVHRMKINEYQGENRVFRSVECTGIGNPIRMSARKEGAESALVAENTAGASAKKSTTKPAQTKSAGPKTVTPKEFYEIDDSTDELPF